MCIYIYPQRSENRTGSEQILFWEVTRSLHRPKLAQGMYRPGKVKEILQTDWVYRIKTIFFNGPGREKVILTSPVEKKTNRALSVELS